MTSNNSSISTLADIIETLRKLDPEFPMICAQALLIVAKNPGLTQTEIKERLDTTQATASRTLAEALMVRYGLVRQEEDSENRRFKRIYLTAKGERFVEGLSALIK